MNCRPGDLAVIVCATSKVEREWLGKIVRVLSAIPGYGDEGSVCWSYEGAELVHPLFGRCKGIHDWALRPIRPQPDDARDETLDWLPVPTGWDSLADLSRDLDRAIQNLK